jgi:hypothetical protein
VVRADGRLIRHPSVGDLAMRRLLDLVGMTAGGWLGWMVGAWISLFTAFVVSVVGTGVGFYLARRVTKQLLP